MPIYEYHCARCDEDFEKLVFNTSPAVTCPKCASWEVKKRISRFSFKRGSSNGGDYSSSSASSCASCTSTSCSTCG